MGAVTLNTVLKSTDSQNYLPVDFSKRFFDAQAAKIDPIWYGPALNISRHVINVNFREGTKILGARPTLLLICIIHFVLTI